MSVTRFVETVQERCRMCYTCVRECPAKAIRIVDGQAQVIGERCIACGNCVRVCSQSAKQPVSQNDVVETLLAAGGTNAVIVAPSFPAEFLECDHSRVVGMLRALGFDIVGEVAFGADLVARWFRRFLAGRSDARYISTACPAVVGFVEKYHPDLVPHLAPVVSPMVATARALRRLHGDDLRVVFVGPCIAKKAEAAAVGVAGEIEAALTFRGMRKLLNARGITPENVTPGDFDPPHGGLGALFPISRGMLQAADINEDLTDGRVVTADGRTNFVEAIKEFGSGDLDARCLEILACDGCIVGPGMSSQTPLFSNRRRVSEYVRKRMIAMDVDVWRQSIETFAGLDLSRRFHRDDQRIALPEKEELAQVMERLGKLRPEDELNCGACGYDTCREHAIAICKGLAENEMCLPHTIEQLRTTVKELAVSDDRLESTRAALIQSEKLASMGQLAAGIAHEVNNPLGIVLMYAHLLRDEHGLDQGLCDDLNMIVEQADRCKKIVAGLLHFARRNKVFPEPTDFRGLIDDVLRSAPKPGDVAVNVRHAMNDPIAEMDADQIAQVFTNIVSNACAAMPEGGTLTVRTLDDPDTVTAEVTDTGTGIREEHLPKIFEPFFTTKQMGEGTGLGLAVTYGIVKMHRGAIDVTTNADRAKGPTGTTFTVSFPRKSAEEPNNLPGGER